MGKLAPVYLHRYTVENVEEVFYFLNCCFENKGYKYRGIFSSLQLELLTVFGILYLLPILQCNVSSDPPVNFYADKV